MNEEELKINNENLRKWWKQVIKMQSIKLGYNEQLGTDQICSLQPGIVLTGLISVVKCPFGNEYCALYN